MGNRAAVRVKKSVAVLAAAVFLLTLIPISVFAADNIGALDTPLAADVDLQSQIGDGTGVIKISENGTDVPIGVTYVAPQESDALNGAIAAAQTLQAKNAEGAGSVSDDEVTLAVQSLTDATAAPQQGTMLPSPPPPDRNA